MTNVIYIIKNLINLMRMKRDHRFIKMNICCKVFNVNKLFCPIILIVIDEINIFNVYLID